MNGLINILKPTGMTSHDVVNLVRRLTGQKRVGHTGTLDPGAAGVLPVCVGKATRVAEYLGDADKEYRAEMVLGLVTDTLDSAGRVVGEKFAGDINEDKVSRVMGSFTGRISQVPPMVSAVKIGGQRLYKLAREGVEVERPPREVEIYQLRLLRFYPDEVNPRVLFHVHCSKGTYVRSLCHDIGAALNCGASLRFLIRTRSGIFNIDEALTLEEMKSAADTGDWSCLLPLDYGIRHFPRVILKDDALTSAANGRPLNISGTLYHDPVSAGDKVRVLTSREELVGVAETLGDSDTVFWQMKKVFFDLARRDL